MKFCGKKRHRPFVVIEEVPVQVGSTEVRQEAYIMMMGRSRVKAIVEINREPYGLIKEGEETVMTVTFSNRHPKHIWIKGKKYEYHNNLCGNMMQSGNFHPGTQVSFEYREKGSKDWKWVAGDIVRAKIEL